MDVRKIVVSVKGGGLKADDRGGGGDSRGSVGGRARALGHVRDREKAEIALFISLEKSTAGMVKDAAAARGGGSTLPPAPTGLDFAQANPGDAVEVTGTLPAGTTLVKIFALLAGASGDPAQVGAAASLPTGITGMTPGDYEFTATVTLGGLESPPSDPFPLTVV